MERTIGARSARRWQDPHDSRTQRLLVLGLLILVLIAYLGYTHWEASRIWPDGSLLLSIDDGQPEAVILGRESDHVDYAGRHYPAYKIKMLKTGVITWRETSRSARSGSSAARLPHRFSKRRSSRHDPRPR